MKIKYAVITAPRKTNYLPNSLQSLLDEAPGAKDDLHIFAEPGSVVPSPFYINTHWNPVQFGCVGNWLTALKRMIIATENDDDRIIMCEDDILWTVGSHQILLEAFAKYPDTVLSLYCSLMNGRKKVSFDWHTPHWSTHGICGALCMSFTKQQALQLLDAEQFFRVKTLTPLTNQERLLDYAIGETLCHLKIKLKMHMPTLIYHLGDDSAMGNDELGKSYITRLPFTGGGID